MRGARVRHLAGVLLVLGLGGCAVSGYGHLPPQQQREARQVEEYFSTVRSLQGHFEQQGSTPALAGQGTFLYVPGALRMVYDLPSRRILVARKGRLMLADQGSGAVTNISLAHNPLGFLLRVPLRFEDGVEVTEVRQGPGWRLVSLARADNPSQGLLTLQFADRPLVPSGTGGSGGGGRLMLQGLQGVDARGHHFELRLSDVTTNQPVPPDSFAFP